MQYRSVADEARRLKRFEIPLPFKVIGFIMGLLLPPVRRRLSRMSGIGVLERA
jgi:hypothetical protein